MENIRKFEEIIAEIDNLINKGVTASSSDFEAWRSKTERFLRKYYGDKSYEVDEFKKLPFSLTAFWVGTPDYEFVKACRDDLEICKKVFGEYLSEIKEKEDEHNSTPNQEYKTDNFSNIFLVHGHNEVLKQSVARCVEKQGIEPVFLSEQANKGKTIIEKLEEHSDISCAICLFTADDSGKANKGKDYKSRARQNVVLEAGFCMGKLGRERVVFIAEKGLELPSDLQGVVYINSDNWELDLLKELKAIGYYIDLNKLF